MTARRQGPSSARAFDVQAFLDSAGVARRIAQFAAGAIIYAQGDRASSVCYVQHGRVKLSVVSSSGKEAVVAILGPGDFFGEGCLAGQPRRMGTASTMTDCVIARMAKADVVRVIHEQPAFS